MPTLRLPWPAVTAASAVVVCLSLHPAAAITPTTFLLPPLLWVLYKQPPKWGAEWAVNWSLVWITGVIGVLGSAGALYSIVAAWGTFKIFAA